MTTPFIEHICARSSTKYYLREGQGCGFCGFPNNRKEIIVAPEPRLSWSEYALELAITAARRSEDPYKKVGSCILGHSNQILSLGYNGAPPGIKIDWSNRDERRKRVIHSEKNALKFISPGQGKLIACTLCPCSECIKELAAYQIFTVYYREDYLQDPFAKELAEEFGIQLNKI